MAYNHGKEERKWCIWKDNEEKVLRKCGTDESTIEQIRAYDREVFNSNRRFYQRLQETDTYLDTVAESEQHIETWSVSKLLDEIENMELYRILFTVDRLTLQIVLLKMQGYSTKEISKIIHLTPNAIYGRMDTLRKKLKKFFKCLILGYSHGLLGEGIKPLTHSAFRRIKIMNSYIDETSKEEFNEDITIREALDSIDDMLASWTKEERLAFFSTFAKPKDIDFVKEIGGIYYVVRSHFNRDSNEDMVSKVNRLLSE